jgi:tetratricopeptide (TPR) repeat protein
MKKLLFFIVCTCVMINAVLAQNAEVINAYNYHKYKEYDKAKIAIDKAILDPKTGISAKTWKYRGDIYFDIAESPEPAVKAIDPNAIKTAYESYLKAMELDTKNAYKEDISKRLPIIANRFANKGIEAYKAKNYEEAITSFETSVLITEKSSGKIDTSLIFNAALAAQNVNNVAKSRELLTKLISYKYPEPEIYRSMARTYMVDKDTTKAMEYIAMGRQAYPADNNLMIDELNVYLARGQSKQMLEKMEMAAAADPKNKSLQFALAATYDNMGKKEQAEQGYLKAIEIDPAYFDAYYNLGAMFYNQAVETFNKANSLPPSKQKEYDAGIAKSKAEFGKALPHLEKALQLEPNDKNTLLSLKEIYARLGDYGKSNEMKKRIEAMKK